MPFVRAGYADDGGSALERTVSLGVGTPMREGGDFLGVGVNWGQPNDSTFGADLSDQYMAEVFYRVQLTQNLAITPDIQWVIDPARSDEDTLLFGGVRARLAF